MLEDLICEITSMTDNDITKLYDGKLSVSVKLVKNKVQVESDIKETESQNLGIIKQLEECKTREEAYELVSKTIKNKKDLELLARYLQVSVLKQDKAEQIKEKIVEATVGAVLRSKAIQGT